MLASAHWAAAELAQSRDEREILGTKVLNLAFIGYAFLCSCKPGIPERGFALVDGSSSCFSLSTPSDGLGVIKSYIHQLLQGPSCVQILEDVRVHRPSVVGQAELLIGTNLTQ